MKNILKVGICLFYINANGQTGPDKFIYKQPLLDFNTTKSIFNFNTAQVENKSRLLRYYALSRYREGVLPTYGPFGSTLKSINDSVTHSNLIYMYNITPVEMITHFAGIENDIFLIVRNPEEYCYLPKYGKKDDWMRKYAKCFEIMFPVGVIDNMDIVDTIIYKLLNVSIYKQKMKILTRVLVRNSKLEKFKNFGDSETISDGKGRFINVPFSDFGKMIYDINKPFLDETGFSGMVNLELNIDNWNDIIQINKQLLKYDLEVKEEIREREMLVIKEITSVTGKENYENY